MISFFRAALFVAATTAFFSACDGFQEQVERVCPALPLAEFSPTSATGYGVKDNLLVTIRPYGVEDSEKFTCPATVCFTLDGSEPDQSRASTQCLAAPVKQIPIKRSTCIKYFVVGSDGTQSVTKQECYRVEPSPVSYCDPKSRSSREPITVSLVSNKAGSIFYTLDGSDPDPYGGSSETLKGEGPKFDVMLDVEGSTTVKFRAQDKDGNVEEKVNTCEYKFDPTPPVTLVTPAGSPTAHETAGEVTVALEADELASIYYTLDGSVPSPSRLNESGLGSTFMEFSSAGMKLTKSTVLTVYSVDLVGNEETPAQQHAYIIGGVPAVGINPGAGTYADNELSIEILTFPASAKVRYTVDGTTQPRCGTPGAGQTFTGTPITDFDRPGDYTLLYRACYGNDLSQEGPLLTAHFTLGASGRPYPVTLDFNDVSQYDQLGSDPKIELNTNHGYIRTRPKAPLQTGQKTIGGATPFDTPQELAADFGYLFMASGNQLSVYNATNLNELSTISFTPPQNPLGDQCPTDAMRGALLGVKIFQYGLAITAITPWTDRGLSLFAAANCGGFARWDVSIPPAGTPQLAYITDERPQFGNSDRLPQPFFLDPAEPTQIKKADSAIGYDGATPLAYLPHFRDSAFRIDAFNALTGAPALTSAQAYLARPTALRVGGTGGSFLAVGDEGGTVYVVNRTTLMVSSQASFACPAGSTCQINSIEWAGSDYLLAAIGIYGPQRGGRIAVLQVTGGSIAEVEWNALQESDPYRISAPVESIRVFPVPYGSYAVASVREQGVAVLKLGNLPSGTVSSLGYIQGSDLADPAFWATDIVTFPGTILGFAVIDAGRTGTALTTPSSGFRQFAYAALADVDKFESSGHFLSHNLNSSPTGVKIGRAKLNEVKVEGKSTIPPTIKITYVLDGVEYVDGGNAVVDGTIMFDPPASDVRVKVTFASDDGGTTPLQVNSIKLQLTPVE